MMTEELKPCPFCGCDRVVESISAVSLSGGKWHWYSCANCEIHASADLGESGARENWNTRPLEDALYKQLEVAKEGKNG